MATKVEVSQKSGKPTSFKRGELVISNIGRIILVTDESPYTSTFSGVQLHPVGELGRESFAWDKDCFTQFQGKITLEGEE